MTTNKLIDLALSVRAYNQLHANRIDTLDDVIYVGRDFIQAKCSKKTLAEVDDIMSEKGLIY